VSVLDGYPLADPSTATVFAALAPAPGPASGI